MFERDLFKNGGGGEGGGGDMNSIERAVRGRVKINDPDKFLLVS